MNDKLDAIANAAMAAVSALDTAANGDLTGVPQNIQDALNKWQNDNEAHAAGTVTAFADAVRALIEEEETPLIRKWTPNQLYELWDFAQHDFPRFIRLVVWLDSSLD